MRLFRLTHRRDPEEAFSGEGARRVAGRWHPAGTAVVYTSTSVSLALLETVVHLDVAALAVVTSLYQVEVPDALVEVPDLAALPADWNHPRRSDLARAFGAAWAASGRSLALAVPSVVVPQERNVLLNPGHPAFARLAVEGPTAFVYDQRPLPAMPPRPRRR